MMSEKRRKEEKKKRKTNKDPSIKRSKIESMADRLQVSIILTDSLKKQRRRTHLRHKLMFDFGVPVQTSKRQRQPMRMDSDAISFVPSS